MMKESDDLKGLFKERRKFVRANIYAITRYFCPLSGKELEIQTRISDISEGGVLIVTFMEGLPIKAPVKMSFVVPGDPGLLVSIEGIVRHTEASDKDLFRSGVEFLKIKEKELQAIRKYVASHPKK